jgi:hypothetical protein
MTTVFSPLPFSLAQHWDIDSNRRALGTLGG